MAEPTPAADRPLSADTARAADTARTADTALSDDDVVMNVFQELICRGAPLAVDHERTFLRRRTRSRSSTAAAPASSPAAVVTKAVP